MKKMPAPIDYGRASSGLIGAIMMKEKDFEAKYDNPTGGRTVMGFAVPSWQRPLVWSDEQKIKFIESVWMGLGLGTYTINNLTDLNKMEHPLNNIVIDGQQRLSALEAYLHDEIEVFGAKWSEVDIVDKRRFKSTKFSSYETASTDEAYLRSYYDLMNFGGTQHTLDQSASLDMKKLAEHALDEILSLHRESGDFGFAYYDARQAEPEVNSPGPEIAFLGTQKGEMVVKMERAVRTEAILDAFRADPVLGPITPPREHLFPCWIVNESGEDVEINMGRGSDGEPYRVNAERRTVERIHEDGLISGEFDMHDEAYSVIMARQDEIPDASI